MQKDDKFMRIRSFFRLDKCRSS